MADSFNATRTLSVNGDEYEYFALDALSEHSSLQRLPFCLKVLLENLLRHEDGVDVTRSDIEALAGWDAAAEPSTEIAFTPSRVLLQDFTGVPAVVDLAAMRDAMRTLGGDPSRINPLSPVELVIDHSVQVDVSARADAHTVNTRKEYERNKERYAFLRWGQTAFENFKVVPPGTGIVHQVNLEYLARVVFDTQHASSRRAYPDTVVGTDSHTTMVNALGVLGWGVGGIEAEAAMLGQAITMLIPQVVGFRLSGRLSEGATATDLVLTVVEMLRERGVVGKFVEFFGDGLNHLPLADRATIANMAPEYGATCGIFPIDEETLRYLRISGRSEAQIALIAAYARAQGMFRTVGSPQAKYSDLLELDMGAVVPSIAGPKRPQDRIALKDAAASVRESLKSLGDDGARASVALDGQHFELDGGDVVIAAITSCTNTSNPAVMIGAGLLARNAAARGLKVKPWVKTSLAPGSLVVKDYLERAGLLDDLEQLGFHIVGFGCTTCIGNSGPLPKPISAAIHAQQLNVASVLSGNRNFEGRVHPEVKMNFLASPPLVVAYAIAGSTTIDLYNEPIGEDADGKAVYLREVWPSSKDVHEAIAASIDADMFLARYANVFEGDEQWRAMPVPAGERYSWDMNSSYVRNPPYFDDMVVQPPGIPSIRGARVMALLGDSITTDHISPAGAIKQDSPAGAYLVERQVRPAEFNSYGSRRGNHEVMMRGTFANVRLRNLLAPGTEGGWTLHQPSGEQMTIFDAAERYRCEGVPLIVLGGKEYGTGSSRDWAAKGTLLLGIKAVLVESFERIHRSNLVGMGVLPLEFMPGEDAATHGIDGSMQYDIEGLQKGAREVEVRATSNDGETISLRARVRIDTPKEWEYYEHGGILHYVVRHLAASE